MSITIVKRDVGSPETLELYDVNFRGTVIRTTVTDKAAVITNCINAVETTHSRSLNRLVVGLGVEWRPNTAANSDPNPVAILQLCVDESCLLVQLLYAETIPKSLTEFLANPGYAFVGVGVSEDARKLERDHGLVVGSCVDLGDLARARYGGVVRRGVGLMEIAEQSELEFDKPKTVTKSRWDRPWLTSGQVKYACLDAYVSYKLGLEMDASQYSKVMRELRWNLDLVG